MFNDKVIKIIRSKINNKNFLQTFFLLFSTVLGLFLGFITNSLLTRMLGKELYGNYALIINIFSFCQIIFSFGLFHSISRLVAVTNDKQKTKGYYLVGCFFILFIFIIMSTSLVIYAFFSESIIKNNLLTILLIAIPFSWIYLLTNLNESFLQGDNKITLLSLSRLQPKVFFTLILIIIYFFSIPISLTAVILINYLTFILVYIYIYIKIGPSKKNFKRRIAEVVIANKRFGFDVYFGSLIASGSGSLSGILISHFGVNNVEVGYYTLATLLASPLALVPNIIATVHFKKFASSAKIETNLTLTMLLISVILFLMIIFLARFIIIFSFGKDYLNAVEILKYLSVGYILYGIGDYYNRFLLAKGRGKELRNASFYVGITLLLSNIIFIKFLGGQGAAIARIASGLTYTVVILFYYKKALR